MSDVKKEIAKKVTGTDVVVNDRIVTLEEVKKFLCPTATEKELYLAMNIIKSYNLNPFKREVHIIKYGDNFSIVVGYEVYLKRAERSGKLNGWKVGITEDGKYARLTINRKDWTEPFIWEVKLSEFSKNQATWKQIPEFMAKKVVIAQGFRMAFPDELGGMPYTQEEQEVFDIRAAEEKRNQPIEMPKPKKQIEAKEEPAPANGINDAESEPGTFEDQTLPDTETPEDMEGAGTEPEAPPVAKEKANINLDDFMKMKSRYSGLCRHCNQEITKGSEIYYSKTQGVYHDECADAK